MTIFLFFSSINPIFEYLFIGVILFLAVKIFLSLILNDMPKEVSSKIETSFLFTLFLGIFFYSILVYLLNILLGISIFNYESILFSYFIFSSLFLGTFPVMEIKNVLLKAREKNVLETYEKTSKKISSVLVNISLLFTFPLISMYFFGNGSMNNLLILFFFSILVSCAHWIFVFPKILKLKERGKKF